jgi:hypothetical protein
LQVAKNKFRYPAFGDFAGFELAQTGALQEVCAKMEWSLRELGDDSYKSVKMTRSAGSGSLQATERYVSSG